MSTGPSFTQRDFRKLRGNLILALLLIAAAGGAVYWEHKESASTRAALRAADNRHTEIDRKLRRVNDEEVELKAKYDLFRQLERRRIVGPEQRLAWIETIHSIRERRKLFPIDYEIAPQQRLGAPAGGYQFASSDMAFRLPLLHEQDLTDLISDLRKEAPALVHVERCRIGGARQDPTARGIVPQLDAQCTLRWITLFDLRKEAGK